LAVCLLGVLYRNLQLLAVLGVRVDLSYLGKTLGLLGMKTFIIMFS